MLFACSATLRPPSGFCTALPVVVQVHSPKDWLVPLDAAHALFDRFPGRKALLELPGRHNDVGVAGDALARTLAEFWPTKEDAVQPSFHSGTPLCIMPR